MRKTSYHHGDLSQQAHRQALATLREQGDSAISLRALARQLGVSAPALYRHYADREPLLAELAISNAGRRLKAGKKVVEGGVKRKLVRGIPLVGGVIGAASDGYVTMKVAEAARAEFFGGIEQPATPDFAPTSGDGLPSGVVPAPSDSR